MVGSAKPIWPTKAVVARYLDLGREKGIKTPGFRVDPTTGAIDVFETHGGGEAPGSAYDRWKAKRDKAA